VAVAVDLPLLGSRRSAKLTARLHAALTGPGLRTPRAAGLWTAFVVQAVVDLRRALCALEDHPEVEVRPAGFAGFGLGALVGGILCAEEPAIRAAVLAFGGGGIGPASVDPIGHVGRFAPRPLLFLNARHDDAFVVEAAEALHDAAADPKVVEWLPSRPRELPPAVLDRVAGFLAERIRAA
jgi:dienelactone hydrolase